MIKKVLAIHDMVCMGRCSLTVVLPALSALEVKVCPLPTAILSSDTGGFGPVYARSLEQEMRAILEKLDALDPSFDAVYSGYLGSPAQAQLVRAAMERYEALRVVDPVMGDMGKLYQSMDKGMVNAMRALCAHADVITPNLTEACFLTDTPMPKGPIDAALAAKLSEELLRLGAGAAVITSVPLQGQDGKLATLVQEKDGPLQAAVLDRLHAHFPGTGDLFASVLTGRLLDGLPLAQATLTASAFVAHAIDYTVRQNAPVREGVLLEALLGELRDFQAPAEAQILRL